MFKLYVRDDVIGNKYNTIQLSVADPGFPVEGRGPLTRALLSENVCENERISSACAENVRSSATVCGALWMSIAQTLHWIYNLANTL